MEKTRFQKSEIGLIPGDWQVMRVNDVAKINERCVDKNFNFSEIEYFDVSAVNQGRLIETKNISLVDAPSRAKRILLSGDILLSTVRPNLKHFFYLKIAKPNSIASTGFAVISSKKINSKFLYYFLTTQEYTDFLTAIADTQTSTYPSFNPSIISNSFCPLPSESEQRAIASVLSSFDDKIELLEKQNETLEKIGEALFKHWFVDFEFPNENGEPYKSSGGKMIWSEELKKEIPAGWGVDVLGKYIRLDRGLSYKGAFLESDTGLPMSNLGTFNPLKGFNKSGLKFYSGCYKSNNIVKSGDLIIANTDITQRREIIGSPAFIPDLDSDKVLFTHHTFAVRHNTNKLSNFYLYYLFQTPEYRERVVGFATGTTVLALPKEAILNLKLSIPDDVVIDIFSKFVRDIFTKLNINNLEVENLRQVRDLLLPKLMSGKIRVSFEVGE